jgi:hypothetical protein
VSYGVEAWCTDRLVTGRLARGRQVVAQAIYRRLTTPRGTLRGGEEEAAYGIDLPGYVGAVGTSVALRALPSVVRSELLKDARIVDCVVTPTIDSQPSGIVNITLQIDVTLSDEGEGFALTLGVSETSVTILGGVEP